jgi:hypothetical protein
MAGMRWCEGHGSSVGPHWVLESKSATELPEGCSPSFVALPCILGPTVSLCVLLSLVCHACHDSLVDIKEATRTEEIQ